MAEVLTIEFGTPLSLDCGNWGRIIYEGLMIGGRPGGSLEITAFGRDEQRDSEPRHWHGSEIGVVVANGLIERGARDSEVPNRVSINRVEI